MYNEENINDSCAIDKVLSLVIHEPIGRPAAPATMAVRLVAIGAAYTAPSNISSANVIMMVARAAKQSEYIAIIPV